MNPLSFIPAAWLVWVRIAVWLLVVGLVFGAGWKVKGAMDGAEIADLKLQHSQAVANALAKTLAAQKKADADHAALTTKLAAIDAANHDNFTRFEHENDRLRDAADAGSVRVRVVGANCPGTHDVPQAGPGGSVDPAAGAELGADARRRYFALRGALGDVQAQLTACQQAAGAMTGQGGPTP